MTTTDITSSPREQAAPSLSGINHVGLTVRDVEASAQWYQRVLRLQPWFQETHHGSDEGGYTVVLKTPDMSLSVGLDHHPSNTGDRFDCTRTGLDHVCFQVTTPDELHVWAVHLDANGVENSRVYDMEGFPLSLVTFVDPDGIQLELLALHS